MNFDKLTKNFEKFPNGPLIQGGFKVFFSVSFVPGGAWAQGPHAAPPRMKETQNKTLTPPWIKGPLGNFQNFGQFVKVHGHMTFNVN